MSINIIWYGHSCFKVSSSLASIIFDPYKDNSVPGLLLPNGLECDQLFISHNHDDHNAVNKVKVINKCTFASDILNIAHDNEGGKMRGFSKICVVSISGYKVCHLGDIGCLPSEEEYKKLENIDIMFAPINGFYTLGADQIFDIYQRVKPKVLIPMHYFYDQKIDYKDNNEIGKLEKHFSSFTKVDSNRIMFDGNNLQGLVVLSI